MCASYQGAIDLASLELAAWGAPCIGPARDEIERVSDASFIGDAKSADTRR